jgi:crossover junction endodeoxyribonuclease RusA
MSNDIIEVFVPGTPITQGSMKGFVRTGKAGVPVAALTHSNPALIAWRMKVTGYLIDAVQNSPMIHHVPMLGAIGARITFRMPRPQQHYWPVNRNHTGEVREDAPKYPMTSDLDKLLRAILDAVTDAQVWKDDGQVVNVSTMKLYADDQHPAGVTIVVGLMERNNP